MTRSTSPKEGVHEEYAKGSEGKIPKGPAVIGLVLLLVLIAVIGYDMFGNTGASSVIIHDPEKGIFGITMKIETASERAGGEWSGDVDVKIFYEGMDREIYGGTADVNDDTGSIFIEYEEFVWGNGNYTIVAEVNDKVDSQIITIHSIAESIIIRWDGNNSDLAWQEPDFRVTATVSFDFGRYTILPGEDPQMYSFTGTLSTPGGMSYLIDSSDYPANTIEYPGEVKHITSGTYHMSGTAENEFCHPDSPFRIIEADSTYQYDSPPFARLGDDITMPLVNGTAVVSISGEDSWDDSGIVEYTWSVKGVGINDVVTRKNPVLDYSFSRTGEYFIELSVMDDSGKISYQDGSVSSMKITVI